MILEKLNSANGPSQYLTGEAKHRELFDEEDLKIL